MGPGAGETGLSSSSFLVVPEPQGAARQAWVRVGRAVRSTVELDANLTPAAVGMDGGSARRWPACRLHRGAARRRAGGKTGPPVNRVFPRIEADRLWTGPPGYAGHACGRGWNASPPPRISHSSGDQTRAEPDAPQRAPSGRSQGLSAARSSRHKARRLTPCLPRGFCCCVSRVARRPTVRGRARMISCRNQ